MWQGWINLAAGAWLIVSAFVPAIRTPVSMFVAGIVIAVFGFWASIRSWQSTVNGIIGIWRFISGIALGLAVTWNFFIAGAVIGLLAIWNVSETHEETHAHAHS